MNYYFILTEACSYHCDFCIRNNISATLKGHMNYDDFCNVAESLYLFDPHCFITLTGGEPTLHPQFDAIVTKVAGTFERVCITSNGSFDEKTAKLLAPMMRNNVYLQISLDGPQEVHDEIRGDYAFERAVNNIRLLHEVSNHIVISTTVGKDSIDHVKQLAVYLNDLNFHHWKVSQVQVENPHKDTILPTDMWNDFVDELLPLCYYRVTIKKMFAFDIWNKHLEQGYSGISLNCNCGLGKNKVYITPQMDVMPCTCMDEICGNVVRDGWESLRKSLDDIGDIAPAKQSVCNTCRYKVICNGGCPGYSKKVFGKLNMGDIRCPFVSENYNQ